MILKKIPSDYISIFHSEEDNRTYIYKIEGQSANYGFRYIYVTINSDKTCNVVKKGEVSWTDDVFSVAKENYTYSYVTLSADESKKYTIEEYQKMFLMN